MNKKTRNILNWMLIAMMVMLPLRGVLANIQADCEMHDEASRQVVDHSKHKNHMMAADIAAGDTENCCCCDNAAACGSECGIGMSVSFITQSVITVPVIPEAAFRTHVNKNPVFRDLAPPIRPPANLQI